MLEKPAYGAPCNGCGLCCMQVPCPIGRAVFGKARGFCPGLVADGPRYSCGLVTSPERFIPDQVAQHGRETVVKAAAWLLGTGTGCDCSLMGERKDKAVTARFDAHAEETRHGHIARRVLGILSCPS